MSTDSIGITSFLPEKQTWNKFVSDIYSGDISIIKMNNINFSIQNGEVINSNTVFNSANTAVSDSISSIQNGVMSAIDSSVGAGVKAIKEYAAPTMLALDSLDKIGKEFDDYIKDTFLAQMFNIKGTDILCSAFCILISFLPCETRMALYKAIQDIKSTMSEIEEAANTVNSLIQTVNATMASATTIAQSAEGLFSGTQTPIQATFGMQATGQTAVHAGSTITASISKIKSTIDVLSKLFKLIAGAKITIPVSCNGNIWSLASAVLFALQGMAVSFADKALTKILNPIEQAIRKMQPQSCVGNLAAAFFNKIISGIKRFKQWILMLIAELFTANNNWGLVYKTFSFQMKGMLELIAFLDALKLISAHFGDLAIACGVSPCYDSPLADTIRSGNFINPTPNNVPATRINEVPVLPDDNIDTLATALAPILGVPLNNIYVGPNQIQVLQPLVTDAPIQIRRLLNDPDIAKELGPGYKLYTGPDNSYATVLYTFDRKCSL